MEENKNLTEPDFNFQKGDVIKWNNLFYHVIENNGNHGVVYPLREKFCVRNINWSFHGCEAEFVRKATKEELKMLGLESPPMNLEKLIEQEQRLVALLRKNMVQQFTQKYSFGYGDVIEFKKGGKIHIGEIVGINFDSIGNFENIKVSFLNNDGEFSTRPNYVHNFHLPSVKLIKKGE